MDPALDALYNITYCTKTVIRVIALADDFIPILCEIVTEPEITKKVARLIQNIVKYGSLVLWTRNQQGVVLNTLRSLKNEQSSNLPKNFHKELPNLMEEITNPSLNSVYDVRVDENFEKQRDSLRQACLSSCRRCGRRSEKQMLFKCSRCKSVCYCNTECQKNDWPFHKIHCKKP